METKDPPPHTQSKPNSEISCTGSSGFYWETLLYWTRWKENWRWSMTPTIVRSPHVSSPTCLCTHTYKTWVYIQANTHQNGKKGKRSLNWKKILNQSKDKIERYKLCSVWRTSLRKGCLKTCFEQRVLGERGGPHASLNSPQVSKDQSSGRSSASGVPALRTLLTNETTEFGAQERPLGVDAMLNCPICQCSQTASIHPASPLFPSPGWVSTTLRIPKSLLLSLQLETGCKL